MAAIGRSRGRTWQAKVMSLHWALAHLRRYPLHFQIAGLGIEPGDRPYESQLGASRACNDQGESRTPKPEWARRSERRVSTSCTTWSDLQK